MRILFYLEPFLDLNQPYVMESWLLRFQRMHEQLKIFSDNYAGRLLAWEAYEHQHQGYFLEEKIILTQAEMRLGWQAKGQMGVRLEWGESPEDEIAALRQLITDKLGDFKPDMVILLSQSEWLKPVFASALFLHAEATWLYAPPRFDLWQLDPVGFGKGRAALEHWSHWQRQLDWGDEQRMFCAQLKAAFRQIYPTDAALSEIIVDLRTRFKRLVMIPLGDYAPSDGQTPVMSVLDWYLEQSSPETAFLITHHPNAPALSKGQRDYLTAKYPNLIVNAAFHTGPLFSHVDAVLGDFTSASSQALLFDKPVISLGDHCPFITARFKVRSPLCGWLEQTVDPELRDQMLYWLFTHYSIPAERLHNGLWLDVFLRRLLDANNNGAAWRVFSEPIVPVDEWRTRPWFVEALKPVQVVVDPVQQALENRINLDRESYQQAEMALEGGDQSSAIQRLVALVDGQTPLWEPYNDLAAMAAGEGDLPRARDLLKHALRADPQARQARLNLVSVQVALEQFEAALADLGPLMRAEPTNPDIFNLARDIVGLAPALSTLAWIRLVADIRAPTFSR